MMAAGVFSQAASTAPAAQARTNGPPAYGLGGHSGSRHCRISRPVDMPTWPQDTGEFRECRLQRRQVSQGQTARHDVEGVVRHGQLAQITEHEGACPDLLVCLLEHVRRAVDPHDGAAVVGQHGCESAGAAGRVQRVSGRQVGEDLSYDGLVDRDEWVTGFVVGLRPMAVTPPTVSISPTWSLSPSSPRSHAERMARTSSSRASTNRASNSPAYARCSASPSYPSRNARGCRCAMREGTDDPRPPRRICPAERASGCLRPT